jgi:sortase A
MRRWIAYSLVLIGIVILAYPKASEWYNDKQQEKLMAQWEIGETNEEAGQAALEQYGGLTTLFEELDAEETRTPVPTDTSAESGPSPTAIPAESKVEPIATIRIPSIKLKLPVLEGATQKNMKSAAAHLKETAPIGEIGNAAIAAHRMRAKGKLFNRLNEVKTGDEIIIETKTGKFTYIVYDTSIVLPTDVSVLNYNDKDKRLTLITCDPVVDPTHRLIVHAAIKE